jgi:hypothetical protein
MPARLPDPVHHRVQARDARWVELVNQTQTQSRRVGNEETMDERSRTQRRSWSELCANAIALTTPSKLGIGSRATPLCLESSATAKKPSNSFQNITFGRFAPALQPKGTSVPGIVTWMSPQLATLEKLRDVPSWLNRHDLRHGTRRRSRAGANNSLTFEIVVDHAWVCSRR